MTPHIDDTRRRTLGLLDRTRQETRSLLFSLDPDRIIHTDAPAWRVRDIIGHLGVWDMEAVRSLKAYAEGGEYHCIQSEAEYDAYNSLRADERRAWSIDQVWAEYDSAHEQLRQIIASLPDEKWEGVMLYPWNVPGTVEYFIRVMMHHEKVDHCNLVLRALISAS